jgi:hypothetical protein
MGGATLARVFVWGKKSEYRFTVSVDSFSRGNFYQMKNKVLYLRHEFF